jgi:hypothetical protein
MKLLSAEYKTRKMGTFVIDLVGSLIIGVILSAMMAFIIKKSFLKENIVLEQVLTLYASIAYITTHKSSCCKVIIIIILYCGISSHLIGTGGALCLLALCGGRGVQPVRDRDHLDSGNGESQVYLPKSEQR